jgi:hypothetical protein
MGEWENWRKGDRENWRMGEWGIGRKGELEKGSTSNPRSSPTAEAPVGEGGKPQTCPKKKSPEIERSRCFSFLDNLVEVDGVEPTTSCMPCKRSSQLSYTPKMVIGT